MTRTTGKRDVLPPARKAVDRAERIILTPRDMERVLSLMVNPPKPIVSWHISV